MEHKHMLILIIVPCSVAVLIVLLLVIYLCTRRREEIVSRDVETSFEVKERDGVEKDLLIKFEDGEDLTVYEILDAPGEVIGKSSYGTLYRASLLSIDRVTLLRFLRPACTVTMKEVVPVMELLGSLRHPNLVPLCAFYAGQRGEKLMVHPFYRYGTLAQLIRDGNGDAHKWHIICRISIGIAQGLDYLHTDLEIPIIHGNLKSNNILLDRHFMPYVSDFGLHLLLNPTAGQEMLEASAAQGYKAPELIKMREVSEETDIYSLGVILLELLTGKEPFYRKPNFDKDIYLPNAIQSAILDHRVADFYHPQILVSKTDDGQRAVNEDHVYEFLQLAVACCSPSPALRPTIKQVLSKLEEIGK
ncbi:putative kinase-like protein TMKL1 [Solanum lycopersicum]|uniref:Protein kinase domain-containing protein n=1 Tax=Solanum lycopersicum TaxID=4081 RepID=A0A3Q7GAX7_SOLLC|nr:putative kinase-like protein TMKL1 [Solanum lycopersicum]